MFRSDVNELVRASLGICGAAAFISFSFSFSSRASLGNRVPWCSLSLSRLLGAATTCRFGEGSLMALLRNLIGERLSDWRAALLFSLRTLCWGNLMGRRKRGIVGPPYLSPCVGFDRRLSTRDLLA